MLTRSQMSDHREQNKALSGIVQSMLITKHLLFVGFSLQVRGRVRVRVRVGVRVRIITKHLLFVGFSLQAYTLQHALDPLLTELYLLWLYLLYLPWQDPLLTELYLLWLYLLWLYLLW